MAKTLIIIGILILMSGFVVGIKTLKPRDYILFTAIVGVIATIFGAFGNFLKDVDSSAKSNQILDNTEITKKNTNDISQQIKLFMNSTVIHGYLKFAPNTLNLDSNSPITIFYGGMTMSVPVDYILKTHTLPMKLGPSKEKSFYPPLNWFIEDGQLQISCKSMDIYNNLIVNVTKNYWERDPKYTSAFNFDENGLEILDNRGNVALSVDFGLNTIKIQGYFIFPEADYIIILGRNAMYTDSYQECKNDKYFDSLLQKAGVERLFVYDNSHGFGARNE